MVKAQFKVAGGTIKGILTVGQLKKALFGLHDLDQVVVQLDEKHAAALLERGHDQFNVGGIHLPDDEEYLGVTLVLGKPVSPIQY